MMHHMPHSHVRHPIARARMFDAVHSHVTALAKFSRILFFLASEIKKYMDPHFLDDQTLKTAAKVNVILSGKLFIVKDFYCP